MASAEGSPGKVLEDTTLDTTVAERLVAARVSQEPTPVKTTSQTANILQQAKTATRKLSPGRHREGEALL